LTYIGLPEKIKGVDLTKVLKLMTHDKKFQGRKNRFVLPVKIGQVKIIEDVPEDLIRQAVQECR
jgi:3-dehydroquinate synthase